MARPGHKIVRATVEDRPRLVTFLRQHFFRHEPLNMSLRRPQGPACSGMILSLHSLHEGTSLVAVEQSEDGTEEVVGVCLNGEATPSPPDNDPCCPLTPEDSKIRELFASISKNGYVWKETGIDKMFDIHVIAVDLSKRREGLGQALVERAMLVAAEEGYPAVSMYCTSHYSACLAEKLGMRCVFQLKYDEYLGEDGCPVFNPPSPHVTLKCYTHVFS